MKKTNIAILGTIGVGKTTLLRKLEEKLKEETNDVVVKAEPSVTIPFINDVLKRFYENNTAWSFCLQLCISAAQEAYFQDLRESDYEYALFDMPFSSDVYSYSHMKHKRMNTENHHSLVGIGTNFPFDYVILLSEDKDTTIKRIKKRNKAVTEGKLTEDQKNVSIEDFSYLDEHISDFKEYQNVWLSRFTSDNQNVKIIKVFHIPELGTQEYTDFVDNLAKQIKGETQWKKEFI